MTFRIDRSDKMPYIIFARCYVAIAKDSRSTFVIIDEGGCPIAMSIFPRFLQAECFQKLDLARMSSELFLPLLKSSYQTIFSKIKIEALPVLIIEVLLQKVIKLKLLWSIYLAQQITR